MRRVESPAGPPEARAVQGSEQMHKRDVLDTPRAGARALRGGSLRTAGYALTILLSLAAAPLIIRHLGNERYGRYMVIIALVAVIAGLTEGGLNATAIRSYTHMDDLQRRLMLKNALGIRLVLTSLGGCAAVGFAAAAGYGSSLVIGAALASVGMLLQLVQGLYAVVLEAELRLGWLTATELLRQAVNVALLVALVLAGAGVVPLLAVSIPASTISLLVTAWLVRDRTPRRPAFGSWRASWPLVRESIPWAAVAAANIVYFRLAIILMSLLASEAQTGYFATSLRVIEVLIGIPSIAAAAAYPILTRTVHGNADRFSYASGRMFELSLVAGTWMALCLEIGARFIIHVLGGSEEAIAVLRIQGPAVIATFLAVGCGFPLLTLKRFRKAIIANVAALLLSGALTIALVGPLGARGAAIAALSAELALAALTVAFLRSAAPNVHLAASAVPAVVLAGALGTGVGLLLPVQAVLAAAAGSCVYFLALRLVGRFPPEARELLGARLHLVNR